MSSNLLEQQMRNFRAEVASSATKVSQKRGVGPTPVSRPASSQSAASTTNKSFSSDLKRKRAEPPPNVVYSQPANTGTGKELMTQITFAIDYLKGKEKPISFNDIFSYLSVQGIDDRGKQTMQHILQTHSKVEYNSKGLAGKGAYRFRPPHNVRSVDELEAYLQGQTTAQGIPAKELKEGWPGATDAIDELESVQKLLVTRVKKDNTPKMVWPDDPSLWHEIDDEWAETFVKVKMPTEDLRQTLVDLHLTPTSQVKAVAAGKVGEKKKKASRRGGKTTNTHMAGVLKDYSHKRPVK